MKCKWSLAGDAKHTNKIGSRCVKKKTETISIDENVCDYVCLKNRKLIILKSLSHIKTNPKEIRNRKF